MNIIHIEIKFIMIKILQATLILHFGAGAYLEEAYFKLFIVSCPKKFVRFINIRNNRGSPNGFSGCGVPALQR